MRLPVSIGRFGHYLRWLADLTIILGLALAFYFWLNRNFRAVMDERLKPYDAYIRGVFSFGDDRYDDAIFAFSSAFPAFSENAKDPLTRSTLSVLCSNYLQALSSCEHPEKYAGEYSKVAKLVRDNTIPPISRDFDSIGWFELRTGQLAPAETAFKRAIQLASTSEPNEDLVDAYKGLLLVNLATGNVPAALAAFNEVNIRKPGSCNKCSLMALSRTNKELALMYPQFGPAKDSLTSKLPDDEYIAPYDIPFSRPSRNDLPRKNPDKTVKH
jgi:tetratricopeptide (TPR) repeat protein